MAKNLFFKSKKADTTVIVLVLLTLVLTGYSLTLFVTSQWGSQEKIANVNSIQDFYVSQDNFEFLIKDISRNILSSSPGDLTSKQFIDKFKDKFEQSVIDFSELNVYWQAVDNGDFSETMIKDGKLYFSLKNFASSENLGGLSEKDKFGITYTRDIVFEIGF